MLEPHRAMPGSSDVQRPLSTLLLEKGRAGQLPRQRENFACRKAALCDRPIASVCGARSAENGSGVKRASFA